MTKLPKFLLTASFAAFALGTVACFGPVNWHPSWAVALPAGAISFGLFLNAYVLQGEVAIFDEETRRRRKLAGLEAPAAATQRATGCFGTAVAGTASR